MKCRQDALTGDEEAKLQSFEKFLHSTIPQFYFGILYLIVKSAMKGNLSILQERLASVAKEMDALNSGSASA